MSLVILLVLIAFFCVSPEFLWLLFVKFEMDIFSSATVATVKYIRSVLFDYRTSTFQADIPDQLYLSKGNVILIIDETLGFSRKV